MKYRKLTKYKYGLWEDFECPAPCLPDSGLCLPDPLPESIKTCMSFLRIEKGVLYIKKGYAWDGSSIPLKKFTSWLWNSDKFCKTASLIHDALCQLIREGLLDKKYKPTIDFAYKKGCIKGGMSEFEANIRYKALRKFGDVGIRKRKVSRSKIFEV